MDDNGPKYLTHTVFDPRFVCIKQSEVGADEALEIASSEGTITILSFRTPVLPEILDDVLT